MSPHHDWLTLREAAEELGVHYMTAYRYVRLGLLQAEKSGSVWQVERSALDRFNEEHSEAPARGDTPWSERLESRLLIGDQSGSWQVVESALASGMEPSVVYTDMIGPALRRIGHRWAEGTITIGEEHIATAVANRLIGRLGPRFARRGRSRGTVIAATPPHERHGLGLEMLADILRGAGYEVITLGTDVPVESLRYSVKQADRLVGVCVSVMGEADAETVHAVVDAIREHAPAVPVLLGGAGVQSIEAACDLGADGWAADGVGAIQELERLLTR
jgi:excisionase family DNA binding protein